MPDPLSPLREIILRHASRGGSGTIIPGVKTVCAPATADLVPALYEPMLGLVLQGAKQLAIGDRDLRHDPASCFVSSVDLPVKGWVTEASAERPYLAVVMTIDPEMLAELLVEAPPSQSPTTGFALQAVTPALLEAVGRLLALLDAPGDVPVLAQGLRREVLYRLLQSGHGDALRQIASANSRLSQVRSAIGWIRDHYDVPLRIDALAQHAGMSRASLHRHFRAAMAMSPVQYRKALRLQEARRLLVTDVGAQRAAHDVG